MALGFAAFFTTRMELMLLVLFLMALHSHDIQSRKIRIVPEMLPDRETIARQRVLEMSTFVAIVLGTSIGSYLFTAWKDEGWKMGVVMVAGGGRRIHDQPQNCDDDSLRLAGRFASIPSPKSSPARSTS